MRLSRTHAARPPARCEGGEREGGREGESGGGARRDGADRELAPPTRPLSLSLLSLLSLFSSNSYLSSSYFIFSSPGNR